MEWKNLKAAEPIHFEILDEEFERYMKFAKILMKELKKPTDKEICAKHIRRCATLTEPSIKVKSERNEFFKNFLKNLRTAIATQPPEYDIWYKPKVGELKGDKVSSFWSPDKRTYIAAKPISGVGILVYMAVTYKPEEGWQPCGFKSNEF